jgi:Flp pilus assembly pilin Flp
VKNLVTQVRRFSAGNSGAAMVEYALTATIVALGCALALGNFKDALLGLFASLNTLVLP